MGFTRGLWPREYGAYAELAFPLLTGFLIGGLSVAGIGFGVAVTSWFLINEPLNVLKGLRGRRTQDELAHAARRRAVVLALLGVAGAVSGMVLAPVPARLAALLPGALAGALAPAVLWGKPKTLGVELLMAAALALMLPPVALAGRGEPTRAAVAAAAWFACFCLATLAVHAIKARAKPELGTPWTVWVAPLLAVLVLAAALVSALVTAARAYAVLSVAPAALVVLAAAVLRVHPRRLKRVGWSLVAGNVMTLLVLLRG
ncbi:MAG: YwiC-like family protein [Gemmatimonadetes bacterium]|nr:YwiC-like family protein [Gemmatimonadota bacterium]